MLKRFDIYTYLYNTYLFKNCTNIILMILHALYYEEQFKHNPLNSPKRHNKILVFVESRRTRAKFLDFMT